MHPGILSLGTFDPNERPGVSNRGNSIWIFYLHAGPVDPGGKFVVWHFANSPLNFGSNFAVFAPFNSLLTMLKDNFLHLAEFQGIIKFISYAI